MSCEAGDVADVEGDEAAVVVSSRMLRERLFVVPSPVEGEKVCLRVHGPIGDGVKTLSRERGCCDGVSLHSVATVKLLVLEGVVVADVGYCPVLLLFRAGVTPPVTSTSAANETPSPLLLGTMLLTGEIRACSVLRRLSWMASNFFWRRCSAARHRSHGAFFFACAF